MISVWKGGKGMIEELYNITAAGYKVVLSACWYLNYISYGDDWAKVIEYCYCYVDITSILTHSTMHVIHKTSMELQRNRSW